MKEIYRSAASILVVRPSAEAPHQILLLHKPRKRDAWQLPQGGVEAGESIEQAAVRELKEEAGLEGVRILGPSKRFYQYDFPASFRRFRPDHVRGQKIEFVVALAPENPVITVDGTEIDGFVWVTPEQLPQYVKRKAYLTIVRDVYEEALALLA